MILAETSEARTEALNELLPSQRADFEGLFQAMIDNDKDKNGYPVIIRLIDPPLHEFLPGGEELDEKIITKRIENLSRMPSEKAIPRKLPTWRNFMLL